MDNNTELGSTASQAPLNSSQGDPIYPAYIRLPRSGTRCAITSMTRSNMNSLVLGPNAPVRSVVDRKRGKIRGARFIETASLLAYMRGLN